MTLSKRQKKLAHAMVAGFLTGGVTAVQVGFAIGLPTTMKAVAILGAAIFGGGISRAAGAYLDWMKTSDGPNTGTP